MAILPVLAQVQLQRDTLLPEDVTVNTWYFRVDDTVLATELAAIAVELDDFYTSIGSRIAASMTGVGGVSFYNLADPEPRVPLVVLPTAISFTPGSSSLPGENAIVLAYHSEFVSGTPNARRRGRVFLGPLSQGVMNETARPGYVVVDSGTRTAIANAARDLLDASIAATGWAWQQFSPTVAAGSSPLAAMNPVVGGWVDDAFDTQRRRGAAAQVRTNWAATP